MKEINSDEIIRTPMEEEIEDNREVCDHCGCVIEEGEERYLYDGTVICEDCLYGNCSRCDDCDEWFYDGELHNDNSGTVLCDSCYERSWCTCGRCGDFIRADYAEYIDDDAYCEGCAEEVREENQRNSSIHEYGYKPDPIFYTQNGCDTWRKAFGARTRFFGCELEIDGEGEDSDNADEILEEANSEKTERIYIKHDGSLDDGFEIVTHPMTLDYHMNVMPWGNIVSKAVELGYRSHNTQTCGFHVHVNRDCLGETDTEQDEVIERILLFVEIHWGEILRFTRRSEYNMNRWAARYGIEKTGKEILKKAKNGCNGRYAAVNLQNWTTIEFRMFRGTLKLNTIYATLQFVNRIVETAIYDTEEKIMNQPWVDFVSQVTEPELIQYLKERRLYVNEDVISEEEV